MLGFSLLCYAPLLTESPYYASKLNLLCLNYALFHKKKEVIIKAIRVLQCQLTIIVLQHDKCLDIVIAFHNPHANPAVKCRCKLHLTCTWHDIIDIGMYTSYKQVSDYQSPHYAHQATNYFNHVHQIFVKKEYVVDLLTKSNFIINYYNINCSIIFYYYKQVDYIAEYIITKVHYSNTIVIINIYCTNNHPCPPCLEQQQ